MRRLVILATAAIVLAAIAAACGGGNGDKSSGIFTIPGNSELAVGPNRYALALIGEDNAPVLEAEGTAVHLTFFFGDEQKFDTDATFVWAIPDVNGFWTADVDFDQAGQWGVEALLVRDGKELQVQRFTFPVVATSQLPNVGDPAPAAENLTLKTESNIKRMSTDPDPNPDFYQMTVAEAIDADKPFVVVFATPAFCQTRFCGPVVDNVKEAAAEFGDRVNFIHVEPFELDDKAQLARGADGGIVVVQAMQDWRLQTEPWVFVVGADGRISSRFEGAASQDELRTAIEKVVS